MKLNIRLYTMKDCFPFNGNKKGWNNVDLKKIVYTFLGLFTFYSESDIFLWINKVLNLLYKNVPYTFSL